MSRTPALWRVLAPLSLASLCSAQTLVWSGSYSETAPVRETGRFLRTDGSGNVYTATGLSPRGFPLIYDAVFVTKRSPSGADLWRVAVPAASRSQAVLNDFVLDRQGNPLVLFNDGFALGAVNSTRVVKLAASNGAVLWNQPASPTAGNTVYNGRLAVDTANNPVVALTDSALEGANRFRVIKLAASNGTTLWSRFLSRNAPTQTDIVTDIAVDSVNDIAVTGTTGSGECVANPDSSSLTYKLRGADGSVRWSRIYAPAGRSVIRPLVGTDGSGNVYLGMTASSSDFRAALVKLVGSSGAVAYAKLFVTNTMSAATHLNDLLVNGNNEPVLGMFGPNSGFQPSYMLVKLTPAGGALWSSFVSNVEQPIGQFFTVAPRLAAFDASNNVLVAGTRFAAHVGGRFTSRVVVGKVLNANGALAWSTTLTPVANATTNVCGIAVSLGNPVVAGSTESGSQSDPVGQTFASALRSTNGAAFWSKVSTPTTADGVEQGTAAACDTANNAYVVGNANGRIFVAKYSGSGARLWAKVFDDSSSGNPLYPYLGGQGVATRGTTDVIVWGVNRFEGRVIKLDPATGAAIWQRKFPDAVGGAAIDSAGNVGVVLDRGTAAVRKLRGTDGTQLWQANYDGLGSDDDPAAIAVDSTNNFIVTGSTSDPPVNCVGWGNEWYHTVKYAASNGSVIWRKTQAPFSAPGLARAVTVLVDGSNNVVVIGSMDSPSSKLDVGAFKYRASDGAVLWQQRRDLGAQNQLVTAGAIDPQGNVAVTCLTPGTTGTDAWTLKLAASNGNPLWNRLAPSGGGSNFPTAVTFGPSGNVFLTGYTFTGTGAAHFLARLNGGNGTLAWSVTSGGAATSFALDPALAVCPNGRLVQVGTTSSPSQLHNVVVRSFTSGL